MRYIIGNPDGNSIEQVIELGNNENFSKLTCSIIPTIEYWKKLDNKILTDILDNDYSICFEYPVKSIENAKSSYTDVMLISEDTNIAIESKWNEKTSYSCKNHKAKRKHKVQEHWISIISNYIGKDLKIEQFKDIEYQLLHRVASACSLNKKNCIVVYQIFYEVELSLEYIKEINKIIVILDSPKIKFYINSVKIESTKNYSTLSMKIKTADKKERIAKIKNTIKKNKLFSFSNESLYRL